MGTVYRARDVLTGRTVAVKRLRSLPGSGDRQPRDLAAAREFRLLCSLRHPHVISVLDYGFEERGPFFTMELLEDPLDLAKAGAQSSFPQQVRLILQTLQALAYLHRRRVVHRDLKPGNVLVEKGSVRVVDFGIALPREQLSLSGEIAGTLLYMAPEMLSGAPADEGTDLYAAGLTAWEVLTGKHPFAGRSLTVRDPGLLLESPPETLDRRLLPIFETWLAERPQDRFSDAWEAARALTEALDWDLPTETQEIRESYLQAADFVGREQELTHLKSSLKRAIDGRGGVVLVSGESGVGKSRLLEELRVLALVDGALVLTGQAIRQGGRLFHAWISPLRWLCLTTPLTDSDAGVLLSLLPELPELLERDLTPAAEASPEAAFRRIVDVVTDLFRRQERPVLLLLEDLQWAGEEEIRLVERLGELAAEHPLLILASYRNDEAPQLREALDGAEEIVLGRLRREAVAELSASMLGEVGRDSRVLDMLISETEGNVFFLVEVVRALAEEAGRLDSVAPQGVPERMTTGGMRLIVRRRLDRVAAPDRALLMLAAVAGRQIDREVLERLAPGVDLDTWLRACSEVSVLEAWGEDWRFAHDKLREGLLRDLPDAWRIALHRRVAQALEDVYPNDAEHLPALAHHWSEAARDKDQASIERAITSLLGSGRFNLESCVIPAAVRDLQRALELLRERPSDDLRRQLEAQIQMELGSAFMLSRGYAAESTGAAFARARTLFEAVDDAPRLMTSLLGLWRYHASLGELETAADLAAELVDLARRTDPSSREPTFLVPGSYVLGNSLLFQGHAAAALNCFDEAIQIYGDLPGPAQERVGAAFSLGQHPVVGALAFSGHCLWLLGRRDQALERLRRARNLADELDHAFSRAFARIVTCWVLRLDGDRSTVAEIAEEILLLGREQGFPFAVAFGEILAGWVRSLEGDREALTLLRRAVDALMRRGVRLSIGFSLSCLAEGQIAQSDPEAAKKTLDEAEAVLREIGEAVWLPFIFRLKARVALAQSPPSIDGADEAWQEGSRLARTLGLQGFVAQIDAER